MGRTSHPSNSHSEVKIPLQEWVSSFGRGMDAGGWGRLQEVGSKVGC